MGTLFGDLPLLVLLVLVLAFLVYVGYRIGIRFLIRRLAGLVFVLLGVTFITFTLGHFAPGGPVISQLGPRATPQEVARLNHFYGLDQPFFLQYWNFLTRLVHLNLGMSFIDRTQSVNQILARDLPTSLQLAVPATVLAVLIGVPLGLFAAVRANTRFDTSVQSLGLLLYAIPSFVIIPFFDVLMIYLNNNNLPSLPITGWGSINQEIAPIAVFTVGYLAIFIRITRTSMLEVLRQDYVRTARAKGLSESVVIWRHAFRNALIPLVTVVGPLIAFAVNGAFIIEDLFNIPGIGDVTVSSIFQRDFPVLQGTVVVLAIAVVFLNLVTDVVYGVIDPRIKVI